MTDKIRIGGDYNNVTRCRIANGVEIWHCGICNIFYNDIENGILLQGSGANSILGNRIAHSNNGIEGHHAPNNNVSGNLIVSCQVGISLGPEGIWDPHDGPPPYSTGNLIVGNEITLCQNQALSLSLAFDTRVYHNNFINNTSLLAVDTSTVSWDDGYPSGGNFWGDYNGTDANGDGIGDQPYLIGTSGFTDNYPLMKRYEDSTLGKLTFGPIAILSATCKTGTLDIGLQWEFVVGNGVEFQFDATASIPGWNGSQLTRVDGYNWTFGDGSTETTGLPETVHAYVLGGLFEATVTVADNVGMSGQGSQKVFVIMPTILTVSTNPASTSIGLIINISGTLKDFYERTLQNQTVICYYKSPGLDWTPIVSTSTDQSGFYEIEWVPSATGAYSILAEFQSYFPMKDYPPLYYASWGYANLSILSSENRYLFSVESNSSVSQLLFNPTALELSFNVTGPQGSIGYANVMMAKDPQGAKFDMKAYIDGEQLNYTSISSEDCWELSFSYPHSTHKILVALYPISTSFFETLFGRALVLAISVFVIVFVAMLAIRKKRGNLRFRVNPEERIDTLSGFLIARKKAGAPSRARAYFQKAHIRH
jgi:hypothetical protein